MELTWSGHIAHEAGEEGKREPLLEQLERRFDPLLEATARSVAALRFADGLSALAVAVLDARHLKDLEP